MTMTHEMTRPDDISEKEWKYAWRQMLATGRILTDIVDDIRALRWMKAAQEHANRMGYN